MGRKKRPKPFDYGKMQHIGNVVHEYDPNLTLKKFYFKKYDVVIEAVDTKSARERIKNMFGKN